MNSTKQIWSDVRTSATLKNTFYSVESKIQTADYLSRDNLRFIKSHLVLLNGTFFPIVKFPKRIKSVVFANEDSVYTVICDFIGQKNINRFIQHNDFGNLDVPLRTISYDDKPNIVGSFSLDMQGLSRLSHEIGHVLIDEMLLKGRKDVVKSEYTALMYEELIPLNYLKKIGTKSDIIKSWYNYNRAMDLLNFIFFFVEYSNIFENEARKYSNLFGDNVLYRESLFTLIGYQVVYAKASLKRMKIIDRFYHD